MSMFTYKGFYDEIINKYPSGNFIEIGCWIGESSSYLLREIKNKNLNIRVCFVDSWLGGNNEPTEKAHIIKNGIDYIYNQFISNTNIDIPKTIIRGDSVESASLYQDNYADFIFIDAGHQGLECYNDMVAWFPKLKIGGTMAGHDIDYPPVEYCIDKFSKEYSIKIGKINNEWHCWRFIK